MSLDRYANYPSLKFSHPETGVLEIVLDSPGLNSVDPRMHRDLADVWRTVDVDPNTSVVIIRGEGKAFSSGGNFDLLEEMIADYTSRTRVMREARDLVYNVINCTKPIIAAIHGSAVGAGLAVAMCSDIAIAAKNARIMDGHTRLGVAAGDHAVLTWPIMAGMAKAKYYLLTNDVLTGEEAERIGLVALAVETDDLVPTAYDVARKLLAASPSAVRWTKQNLNNWFRAMGPSFDASLAMEFYGFAGPDPAQGVAALKARSEPTFTGATGEAPPPAPRRPS